MTYISSKIIKGRRYAYLTRPIRMPDGNVIKLSKLLSHDEKKNITTLVKKYGNYFDQKEIELAAKWAVQKYKAGHIFSAEEIRKIEIIKVSYNRLIKNVIKEQRKDIFDRFTANFTYDSNAIEGNSLTLKDVAVVMFDKESIPGKPLREIYETRNSCLVVDMLLKKRFKLEERDIVRMHHMLMRDIDPRRGYKILPNIIYRTEKEVHTTPPENVGKEMKGLIEWFNSSKLHPLERAAILHGKFEKIHPFEDGNGRVGRFLINAILVNSGYPPLIIRKTSRQAYMSALSAFDTGHEDKLKRFILERFKETYRKFFEVYASYADIQREKMKELWDNKNDDVWK